jgi:hypothetical protein
MVRYEKILLYYHIIIVFRQEKEAEVHALNLKIGLES